MNIKKLMKNKKGFTLIEIIVVVVILAVLMAVAVPSVMKYMGEADDARFLAQARGGMIVAQAEASRQWIEQADDAKTNSWTATTADISGITGTPTVKGITATIDETTGEVKEVVVTFEGKKATVTPNGTVKLDDITPPSGG